MFHSVLCSTSNTAMMDNAVRVSLGEFGVFSAQNNM